MNYKIVALIEAAILVAVIAGFVVYGTRSNNQPIILSGAGATFPAPLIQKWSAEFKDMAGVQINYEGIGSGGGVKQFTEKTIDFGATDPPMKDSSPQWMLSIFLKFASLSTLTKSWNVHLILEFIIKAISPLTRPLSSIR